MYLARWQGWLNDKYTICTFGVPKWIMLTSGIVLVTLLLVMGLNLSWSHLGVLAQFLVAFIALGGYALSYSIYKKQEAHKYRPAVTVNFISDDSQQLEGLQGRIPGFILRFSGPDPVLHCNFVVNNISESPVTDLRMNFYLHSIDGTKEPASFFEEDIPLFDGLSGNTAASYTEQLRAHKIKQVEEPSMPEYSPLRRYCLFNFSQLFISLIPSDCPGGVAHISAWSLVVKYSNLRDENYFSVYKLDSPQVQGDKQRMRFYGSFRGDYLRDELSHEFIKYGGFPNMKSSPNWEGVQQVIAQAMQMTETFRQSIDDPGNGFTF